MSIMPATALLSRDPKAVLAALGVLVAAATVFLTTFAAVDWSAGQTALVTAEASAVLGFVAALAAHLKRATAKEHVALAGTFTAVVSATLALGTGFGWWQLTQEQTGALLGMVTAVIAVASAVFARQHVTAEISPSSN